MPTSNYWTALRGGWLWRLDAYGDGKGLLNALLTAINAHTVPEDRDPIAVIHRLAAPHADAVPSPQPLIYFGRLIQDEGTAQERSMTGTFVLAIDVPAVAALSSAPTSLANRLRDCIVAKEWDAVKAQQLMHEAANALEQPCPIPHRCPECGASWK